MILKALAALKCGYELRDPAKWKRGQQFTNAIGGIVAFIIFIIQQYFPNVYLPAGIDMYAVEAITAILVAVNLYFIPATTTKIGIK